jgi:hypothetical protein
MTKCEALIFAKKYCRAHNIHFRSARSKTLSGGADICTRTIYVSTDIGVAQILSTVFHEVMHILCSDAGVFPLYHVRSVTKSKLKYRQLLPHIVRQAYRAERKVDELARQEMRIYFPGIKYRDAYSESPVSSRKFLIEYYKGGL